MRAVYTNKPQTVTITYHYNFEGSSTQPFIDSGYPKNTTATVKSLSEVKFTAPTGYKFLGWATAPDSNKIEYAAGDPVFVDANGDNDLYAIWQVKTYTVTYDLDGGEWTEATNEFPYEYKATVEVVKTVPTREGYTFADWTSEEVEVANGKFTMPAKNVTLKAKWNINKYTVKWVNWDGSEVRTDTEVPYGTKLEAPANPTRAADAQYTYTFKDWDKPLEKVTKDVTYTAVYDKAVNKYTIKWVNWDGSEVRTDTEVPYGTKLEAPADPTRAADAQYTYTFKDWTPEVKTVTGDATYKATYTKEANSYTLTYDLDGGEWENDTTYTYPKKYNEEVEVKADPTKEGYTFAGWTSAEVKVVNGKFTMPAKNVTLTAQWKANIYKVTYDLDGGEWTETTNEFPYEYKATVEVIKTVPTREGYKFSGWRSEEVTIENDAFTMPAKDVVLKAVWEANPTPTPIPSEEPTPTPAPSEEPTPTPAPSEEPTPTPAPTEEPTPTPAP
ncbi:InlB B-repeat-containing protein, partial [Hominenteromicrobium sp.]|uniref:InlB B-repeat-containing protein n=1 Tax=Hominenteromicrobium sp. TaxID=3073581 RepID=UPI003AF8EAE9